MSTIKRSKYTKCNFLDRCNWKPYFSNDCKLISSLTFYPKKLNNCAISKIEIFITSGNYLKVSDYCTQNIMLHDCDLYIEFVSINSSTYPQQKFLFCPHIQHRVQYIALCQTNRQKDCFCFFVPCIYGILFLPLSNERK